MELSEKQELSIATSSARINLWEGSVRSGKTVATIIRFLHYIMNGPPGPLGIIGKTERTIKRNILDQISGMVGSSYRYSRGVGEVYIKGRKIDVFSANDIRAEDKIRGMTGAGFLGDEVTLWPQEVFKMMLSRMSIRGAKFFGTTNPDSPYHWLKEDYIDRVADLNMKVFHFGLDDNPFLPPEYVTDLKKEYTGLWYQRFILGLWVMAEGAIYDMFDENVHVGDYLRWDFKHHIIGVDYGTTNPTVFIRVSWNDPKDLYITKEYRYDSVKQGRQKTDDQYVTDYIRWIGAIKPDGVYVDPSAASFIVAMRKKGVKVLKAKNDVLDGIRCVSNFLAPVKLHIDKRCRNTIKEFSSYVWDEKSQEKGEDKPLKINDHCMDAVRYPIFTKFGKRGGGGAIRV